MSRKNLAELINAISNAHKSGDPLILSWDEVLAVHPIRSGIHQRNGRLVSLLTDFGRHNPCYPDFYGNTTSTIHYTGSGRRGDQKLDLANRALRDAIDTCHAVPLFNKITVGRWQSMGFWRVTGSAYVFDEKENRMLWKFTLEKLPAGEEPIRHTTSNRRSV